MDEATLKSNPSSRSKERSEKRKLHHGVYQDNVAMRVVVAIGFTILGLMNILIIGSVAWEQSSVRRAGTGLTDGASTGKTSQNSIKVVDLTRRPKTNQYQFRLEVEPPLRVFEKEKSSAIKPTEIGTKIESATKDTGLSCGKNNVQCKFRSGGEPLGHKGSQAWDDDQGLSSLHRSYLDEYESKLLLLLETSQKALARILDSRLENHAWSTPMTTHDEVGNRYEADFGVIDFSGGNDGIIARLQYFLDTGIYSVCPSPSSVENLFQYEYCPILEGPRLRKRAVSGIIRDHLYAHGSAFRSLPDANTPLLWPVSLAKTSFALPDANTPLLGPMSWARTSFLSAIQTALFGSVSRLWRLDWSCLNRAITLLPFDKSCEEVIRQRISGTQISGTSFFLFSLPNLVFVLYYWRKVFLRSTPKIDMRTVWSEFRHSLEPPLGNGKRRIRWMCKCGQRLYDDFQEIRPEAAAQLEYELNRRYNNVGSKSSNGGQGSHGNSGRNRGENPACSNVTSWWFPSSWGSAQSSSLPFHEPQNVPGDDIETAITEPQPESMFLLLCIPHLRWASKLVHMDVHKLRSDQSFFEELRSHYHSMRGLWTSWFSLKQLTRIQFVQFELHKNELVDIRKLNDLPPETRDDYRYRPVPPEIIPPIGENLIMHLYDHPEDADDDGFCLDRVPKKLRKRLTCSQRIGWGVNFSEGLNVKKVRVLGLIGLFTSTAFGMAWSIKRNDVQGGFGVAAFVLMALTFVTGILQAALDTK